MSEFSKDNVAFSFQDGHERYRWLLATPAQRMGAAAIDTILSALVIAPIVWLMNQDDFVVLVPQFSSHPLSKPQDFKSFIGQLSASVLLAIVYFLGQAYWLGRHAQTMGKRILGIKIVRDDGHSAGFYHALLLRTIVFALLSMIVIGGILNVLHLEDNFAVYELFWLPYAVGWFMIFNVSENRVTLQDKLARTVVVQQKMHRLN